MDEFILTTDKDLACRWANIFSADMGIKGSKEYYHRWISQHLTSQYLNFAIICDQNLLQKDQPPKSILVIIRILREKKI